MSAESHRSHERSHLLIRPSSCSTDGRSSSSLLSYNTDESAGLLSSRGSSMSPNIQLPILAGDQDKLEREFGSYATGGKYKRHRLIIAILTVIFGTAIVLQLRSVAHRTPSSSSTVYPPVHPTTKAFSLLDPVLDLGLVDFPRPSGSNPPKALKRKNSKQRSFPTNAWYQNLLLLRQDKPQQNHRAYAIPYVLDLAGSVPGIRVHHSSVGGSTNQFQVNMIESFGLTLGAASRTSDKIDDKDFGYNVLETTPLGVTLEWETFAMRSSIVRGMPYATMEYKNWSNNEGVVPTVASEITLLKPPIIDGNTTLDCKDSVPVLVKREVEMTFKESDFTWLLFTSKPIMVACFEQNGKTEIRVVDSASSEKEGDVSDLVLRVALLQECSTNSNPVFCHQEALDHSALHIGQGRYRDVLRQHAGTYPGMKTSFSFGINEDTSSMELQFDWDPQYMEPTSNLTGREIVAYALPHHMDMFSEKRFAGKVAVDEKYCTSSLLGPTCLMEGSTWKLIDDIPQTSLRSPRIPKPEHLRDISQSLKKDIRYELPAFYKRGAGDTYFSGKMLAKLGRILVMADELREICSDSSLSSEYTDECKGVWLPSSKQFEDTLEELRSSVEIWLDGDAVTPFVYDSAWGGVVSCGCVFDGKKCKNKFPECAAFSDPGLNFGNAYYNDMHFHYGYHIYGAAIVAHFDHEWGRKHFERVNLLARTIANPDEEDKFFVPWRHKDWYQGHSWASGIATAPLNGRNQESSSEAIAAYEAVTLYGETMISAWSETGSLDNVARAKNIQDAGRVLVASELRSAHWYWHVSRNSHQETAPSIYKEHVVGILWQTMAQLQTWFGAAPHLAYGIQLLPLTPISEQRDGLEWSKSMYKRFASSCESNSGCVETGWRVLQLAMLATVGHQELAFDETLKLDDDVFDDAGGNGHSRSNSLWYIATRPRVAVPLVLDDDSLDDKTSHTTLPPSDDTGPSGPTLLKDCGVPSTCTNYVLDTIADIYSCGQRMEWLMKERGYSEEAACVQVATNEFPKQCGKCSPGQNAVIVPDEPHVCAPCSDKECKNLVLSRCPRYEQTFVCTSGASYGGCSRAPWEITPQVCSSCCELTDCPIQPLAEDDSAVDAIVTNASNCPPCTPKECQHPKNLCPSGPSAPFLCMKGRSTGGCSPTPWSLDVDCDMCCNVMDCAP